MPHSEDWAAPYEAEPAGSDAPSGGDDEIRDLKRNVRERLEGEHYFKDSQTNDGKHLLGSARAWVTNAEPTTQPNGSAVNATVDTGRLWFNDTQGSLTVYTGANFITPSYFDANLTITGTLTCAAITSSSGGAFSGDGSFTGDLSVGTDLDVGGTLTVAGNTDLDGNLNVAGTTTLAGAVTIDTNPNITGTLTVAGAVSITSELNITGITRMYGNARLDGNLNMWDGSTAEDHTISFASDASILWDESEDKIVVSKGITLSNAGDHFEGAKRVCSFIDGRTVTKGAVFSALSPYIPNTNDSICITGGVGDGTNLTAYALAFRASSTHITLKGVEKDDTVESFLTSGGSGTFGFVFLAW